MIDEWNFEPNTLNFKYNNLECKIIRRKEGHLTAYVLIDNNHPLFGKDYDELFFLLKEKGIKNSFELSYSDFMNNSWAFGFGYASVYDFIPELDNENSESIMYEWFNEFNNFLDKELNINKEYKNIEKAIEDVKELADCLLLFNTSN